MSSTQIEALWTQAQQSLVDGDLDAARAQLEELVAREPGHVFASHNLATLLVGCEEFAEALPLAETAVAGMPGHGGAWNCLGIALKGRAHAEEEHVLLSRAIEAFANAVRLEPGDARYHVNLATTLMVRGRIAEATAHYQLALGLDPERVEIRWCLGQLCFQLGQYRAAGSFYASALAGDVETGASLSNVGMNQMALGDMRAAGEALRRSAELEPSAERRAALSCYNLMTGNFAEGWEGYELRGEVSGYRLNRFGLRPWQGEALAGRSILLFAEQGVGDEIMFAGCFSEIAAAAERCIILCDARMAPLFARAFAGAEVHPWPHDDAGPAGLDLTGVDFGAGFGSLARYLRSQRADFPGRPYLQADPERVGFWRDQLAQCGPRPHVGISWRGGRLPRELRRRSTVPADWHCLREAAGTLISIQYDHTSEDLQAFADQGIRLVAPEGVDAFEDMDEFAALVAALDRVISVDNSTVHLAGALGVDTDLLLSMEGDWRWTWQEPRSLWYPCVRLHWREAAESWDQLIARAASEPVESP